MGAKPNYQVNHHKRFLCLTVSSGEGGYHKGAQFGPAWRHDVADSDMPKFMASLTTFFDFAACSKLCFEVGSGSKPLSDLDAWMATKTATWTTPPFGAPFGGSLADFWASLATHEKTGGTVDGVQHMGFVSAILVASIDAVICS